MAGVEKTVSPPADFVDLEVTGRPGSERGMDVQPAHRYPVDSDPRGRHSNFKTYEGVAALAERRKRPNRRPHAAFITGSGDLTASDPMTGGTPNPWIERIGVCGWRHAP